MRNHSAFFFLSILFVVIDGFILMSATLVCCSFLHYYYTFVVNIEHWKLVAASPVTSDVCSELFIFFLLSFLFFFSLSPSVHCIILTSLWFSIVCGELPRFLYPLLSFHSVPWGEEQKKNQTIKQPRINCTFHFSRAILFALFFLFHTSTIDVPERFSMDFYGISYQFSLAVCSCWALAAFFPLFRGRAVS